MNEEKIQRINELYRKSKEAGLTDAEKEEQQTLRQEYITKSPNIPFALGMMKLSIPDLSDRNIFEINSLIFLFICNYDNFLRLHHYIF